MTASTLGTPAQEEETEQHQVKAVLHPSPSRGNELPLSSPPQPRLSLLQIRITAPLKSRQEEQRLHPSSWCKGQWVGHGQHRPPQEGWE